MIWKILFVVFRCFLSIDAHGYLFEPVARSSAWLVDESFKQCCTYPGHMEMFCGGVGHQWNSNGGKCGICGEPYDRAVKLFEKGGRMYTGKSVKTYKQGQQIEVKVKLSANHQGYFEFRLCNVDTTPEIDATDECLDRHLLTIVETNSTKLREIGKYGSEMINIHVQLPMDMACEHCVFQWKYTTGNNWGRDPTTNKSGPGLGRENETFMGCADITIHRTRSTTTATTRRISPSSPRRTIRTTTKQTSTSSSPSSTFTPTSTSTSTVLTTKPKLVSPRSIPNAFFLTSRTTTAVLRSWSGLLVAYERGDEVIYNGMKYRCVTSHRSYAGAEPGPLTWALWRKIN